MTMLRAIGSWALATLHFGFALIIGLMVSVCAAGVCLVILYTFLACLTGGAQ